MHFLDKIFVTFTLNKNIFGMEVEMAAKFEIYKDKKGEFRFRLVAANGQVIATSQGYKSKASCMKGIESVKQNTPKTDVVEV